MPTEQQQTLPYITVANLVLILITLVGCTALLYHLGLEVFDADEYNAMNIVGQGFIKYVNEFHFSKTLSAQFWILDRLFDGALWAYRLPGAISGICYFLLFLFFTNKFISNKIAVCWGILLLTFSTQSLFYLRWGMPIYGEYFLLSGVLYYHFIVSILDPYSNKNNPYTILLAITLPWIHFGLLLSFFTLHSVALVLFTQEKRQFSIKSIIQYLKLNWYCIASVPSFVLSIFILEPWNWFNALPYLMAFEFKNSGFSQTIPGAIQFGLNNSWLLLVDLVKPNLNIPNLTVLGFEIKLNQTITYLSLLFSSLSVLQFRDRRTKTFSIFRATVLYLFLTVLFLYFLSILGLYRFGTARYAIFLQIPLISLCCIGLSNASQIIRKFLSATRHSTLTYTTSYFFQVLILIIATLSLTKHIQSRNNANESFLEVRENFTEIMTGKENHFVLIDGPSIYWARVWWPEWKVRGEWMGYQDKRYSKEQQRMPSDELTNALNDSDHPTKIVTITRRPFSDTQYGEYSKLLHKGGMRKIELAAYKGKAYLTQFAKQPQQDFTPLETKLGLSEVTTQDKDTIYIRGWALAGLPITEILLEVRGFPPQTAKYPQPRPDIFKHLPDYHDKSSGFSTTIISPNIADKENLRFSITIKSGDTILLREIFERKL